MGIDGSQIRRSWTRDIIKHLFVIILITIALTVSASASTEWRHYQRECNGNVSCMKAQAAAYQEFNYGDHNREFQRICRATYISSNSMNYSGALQCVRKMQADQDDREYQQAVTRRNEKRADYYDKKEEILTREYYYRKCVRNGGDSKRCSRKYLK